MYNYYDELNKVRAAIEQYMSRVHADIIVIPQEELTGDETPVKWAASRIIEEVIANIH